MKITIRLVDAVAALASKIRDLKSDDANIEGHLTSMLSPLFEACENAQAQLDAIQSPPTLTNREDRLDPEDPCRVGMHSFKDGKCVDCGEMEVRPSIYGPKLEAPVDIPREKLVNELNMLRECNASLIAKEQQVRKELNDLREQTRRWLHDERVLNQDAMRTLKQERELHSMQLAAISTACNQDTDESRKQRITKGNACFTAAYEDACRKVDQLIQARAAVHRLQHEKANLSQAYDQVCLRAQQSSSLIAGYKQRLSEIDGLTRKNVQPVTPPAP